MNSLISCDEEHRPNVDGLRQARSAHLYRQSQSLARTGLDLHHAVLADWIDSMRRERLNPVVIDVSISLMRASDTADDADLEEVNNTERHLLYIACTRTHDHLRGAGITPVSEFVDDFLK
ncbi:MAG: hypothetical protein U0934_04460 [Pseudotabrizicola sp.]|uniref:hypothetical protein n=1 Tax=Pseudotabrizicola sp. TaxID=2939647 RepID=UPI00272F8A4D|nr:hypothetical protein [Pseudotabrizicola sp.]MDP2079862.1 hypothetical protein [Pseudotabrizicola sp.]MDZ7573191.1 hypothetical protein [Pseudotabrizicola sp.]